MAAAINNHHKIVTHLIKSGAQIEDTNNNEQTPLLLAAKNGSFETVKILIEHKAFVNHNDKNGNTPAIFAASEGHLKILEQLIIGGACIRATNNNGSSPMTLAIKNKHLNIVQYLIKNKVSTEVRDQSKSTPLILAAKNGNYKITEYLIKNGANIETRNEDLQTPLSLAVQNNHLNIIKYLIENGANTDYLITQNDKNKTHFFIKKIAKDNQKIKKLKTKLFESEKNNVQSVFKKIKTFFASSQCNRFGFLEHILKINDCIKYDKNIKYDEWIPKENLIELISCIPFCTKFFEYKNTSLFCLKNNLQDYKKKFIKDVLLNNQHALLPEFIPHLIANKGLYLEPELINKLIGNTNQQDQLNRTNNFFLKLMRLAKNRKKPQFGKRLINACLYLQYAEIIDQERKTYKIPPEIKSIILSFTNGQFVDHLFCRTKKSTYKL